MVQVKCGVLVTALTDGRTCLDTCLTNCSVVVYMSCYCLSPVTLFLLFHVGWLNCFCANCLKTLTHQDEHAKRTSLTLEHRVDKS